MIYWAIKLMCKLGLHGSLYTRVVAFEDGKYVVYVNHSCPDCGKVLDVRQIETLHAGKRKTDSSVRVDTKTDSNNNNIAEEREDGTS